MRYEDEQGSETRTGRIDWTVSEKEIKLEIALEYTISWYAEADTYFQPGDYTEEVEEIDEDTITIEDIISINGNHTEEELDKLIEEFNNKNWSVIEIEEMMQML